jgi:aldose 1-epimerase
MHSPRLFWISCVAAMGIGLSLTGRTAKPSSLLLSSVLLRAAGKRAANLSSEKPPEKPVNMRVGGEQVITISQKWKRPLTKPEFLSATILPGRGMNLLQITANVPGKGRVEVLASPNLEEAAHILDNEPRSSGGVLSFSFGGAFLVPYANRIRGMLTSDQTELVTNWKGKKITLPAVWKGKTNPNPELHAIHGLILNQKPDSVSIKRNGQSQTVTGVFHAGDFNGHWLSKTDIIIAITLSPSAVDAQITAKNVGDVEEPMGIGWHPYFAFPSGDRKQVRLRIPAKELAEVNNYDDVFPTGKLVPVSGTKYDFSASNGKQLSDVFLDDNFSDLTRENGSTTVDVVDALASYGLHIRGLTNNIKTIQVYAPPDKQFAAIEEQLNFADPFSSVWNGMDTGMVTLQPGQQTMWKVRLELFTPETTR